MKDLVPKQKIKKRAWGLCLALAAGAILAAASCRDNSWDPGVAAKVGDGIIEQERVDKILELGFYPFLAEGEKAEGAVSLGQVLDKLINEKLLLMEAERRGLSVSPEEVEALAQKLKSPWMGEADSPEDETRYKIALHNQLLLRKITDKIIAENLSLTSGEWREFWAKWPKGEKGQKFHVRVLMTLNKPDLKGATSLAALAERLQNTEDFVLSEPFWLAEKKLSPSQSEALDRAWRSGLPLKMTAPEKISSGWAVYEVLGVKLHDPVSEIALAQRAFEARAADLAFQRWLDEARKKTPIAVNPALLDKHKKKD